jgi:hypothetical protein
MIKEAIQEKVRLFLIENIFKSLMVIAKNVGIKKFKPYLELVLDQAFRLSRNQE